MKSHYQFTSESVTEGHPDKLCDQIADSVLDHLLAQDPMSRVACEVCATTGLILVMGEITTSGFVDVSRVARETIERIGYTRARGGFDAKSSAVLTAFDEQSPDIARGVDHARIMAQDDTGTTGAGDQGLMFGFAIDDTPELMPLPITLAHRLTKRLSEVRRDDGNSPLCPDGKAQVTVRYEDRTPVAIDAVVVSTQHMETASLADVEALVMTRVVEPVLAEAGFACPQTIYINPTGRFVIGGPEGDSGLTGRKLMCDTYGGMGRHGGGSFSGKDPTKVDRSASYLARFLAKNIVAAELARTCEVQIAYAIGVAEPVSLFVNTFGTGVVPETTLERALIDLVDMRPEAIIERFDLRRPLYQQVSCYGHFGRPDLRLPWESTSLVKALKTAASRL